jgi:hypothetical protein
MKKHGLILAAFVLLILAGCNKDNASKWVGSYMGTNGVGVNEIVVTEVDKNDISLQLQTPYQASFVTFVTIKDAKLKDANDAVIDEYGYIVGDTTSYHFVGTANLNNNTITFSGSATNITGTVVKTYSFTGTK